MMSAFAYGTITLFGQAFQLAPLVHIIDAPGQPGLNNIPYNPRAATAGTFRLAYLSRRKLSADFTARV